MKALALALAILPLPGDPPRASVPTIDAGDVATIVVQWPAEDPAAARDYVLRIEPGFRSLVPDSGSVGSAGGVFVLAVALATPRHLPAGEMEVGSLVLWSAGPAADVPLRVRVRERRSLVLELETEELYVVPGQVASLGYRVRNRGNVADTAAITLSQVDGWVASRVPPAGLPP